VKLIAIFLFVYLSGTSGMCSEPHFNLLKKKEVISQDNTNGTDDLYRKVLKSNNEIKDILNRKSSIPVIWDGAKNINTGKIFRGTLLNSIVSTNLSSPLIVKAHSNQGLKVNTRFICQGVTKHKRVHTICTKMVSEGKERTINAQLLNLDGTAGLIGEYDSNKESLIAGSVLNSFSQGILSAAGDRVQTNLGTIDSNTLKNQVISGLITGADTTNNLIQDEINNSEPIVTINAGAEVLIYFLEAPIEN
jgi:hypothetical protein